MELKYIVYITINQCNGKFYIGVHKTNPEVFDGYIGCGIYNKSNIKPYDKGFHKAVRKYGYENFKRTTIDCFPNTEEGMKQAYELEGKLVTSILLKSKQSYNIALGGKGSIQEESKKKVYMFDLNGNYLRSYKSTMDAARSCNVENAISAQHAIRNNCLKSVNSALGYYWSYIKKFEYNSNKKLVKVAQYTLSGKFLRYFDSLSEAERELEISTIQQAITKKYSAANFQWRYYNGDNSNISPLLNIGNKNKILPIIMFNEITTIKYKCVLDCVKENPELKTSQINRVLTGVIKSHKGWSFKYQDEDIVSTN